LGFSLENIIDSKASYAAPDRAFMGTVSGMVQSFPWGRFEQFFEARPLIEASALDQVFLLRVLAMQEVLCMDDESILKWLKSQMYLFAFLSPGFKPKVPTKALLQSFRAKLQEADLLAPFRLRCQRIILKQDGPVDKGAVASSYLADFAPTAEELSADDLLRSVSLSDDDTQEEIYFEDKWVICPKCEGSALNKATVVRDLPKAHCKQCGHEFKV